ncbi:response regulator receiver domain-containing protein [Rutstroemia sp. NJR-2017a WRK4]|nr:response regulator receiver domain-containing protein [Rutstroemia sp. NJR-2017a WRK4]
MSDLKTRLKAKFSRRHSYNSSTTGSSNSNDETAAGQHGTDANANTTARSIAAKKTSTRSLRSKMSLHQTSIYAGSTTDKESMVGSPREPKIIDEEKGFVTSIASVASVASASVASVPSEEGGPRTRTAAEENGDRGQGVVMGMGMVNVNENNGIRSGSEVELGVAVGVVVGAELSLNFPGCPSDLHLHQHQTFSDQQQLRLQSNSNSNDDDNNNNINKHDSTSSTADFPTPGTDIPRLLEEDEDNELIDQIAHPEKEEENNEIRDDPQSDSKEVKFNGPTPITQSPISPSSTHQPTPRRPPELTRRQSLLPHQQTKLIKTLLSDPSDLSAQSRVVAVGADYFSNHGPATISATMVTRKIWVKRPGASATLVTINEDDLVDDVRDMILKKYANSLGRSFDAPDVTLRIVPREQRQERTLGPEEPMTRTLDAYFPGGQTVDEALIIDVPLRRTPRPSPRPNGHGHHATYYDEVRPTEAGSDYFPPMPIPAPSPGLANSVPVVNANHHAAPLIAHAMSVLTTGHVPPLPSPGSQRRHHSSRPRIGRTHTSSPTVIGVHSQASAVNNGTQYSRSKARSRTHSSASEKSTAPPPPPTLPTPPAVNQDLTVQRVATPPPRVSSPRPGPKRQKKKSAADHPSLPAGMLNGAVPPINVLIVEDNIINLKLLEAFVKRLKVRWQTAMNGREAVNKWRSGGFHLVLMDIQLPIMSGLEATKEIRRLERLNSIGVFSSSASSSAPSEKESEEEPDAEDKLPSSVLFKSPVIIVALTASSLQSDRHEALAAGCNDFLTKPVNFVWLERKVMEWGCMQALIDFDGWRKWKDFSSQQPDNSSSAAGLSAADMKKKELEAKKKKKNRTSLSSLNGVVAGAGAGLSGQGGTVRKIEEGEEGEGKAEGGGEGDAEVAVVD